MRRENDIDGGGDTTFCTRNCFIGVQLPSYGSKNVIVSLSLNYLKLADMNEETYDRKRACSPACIGTFFLSVQHD